MSIRRSIYTATPQPAPRRFDRLKDATEITAADAHKLAIEYSKSDFLYQYLRPNGNLTSVMECSDFGEVLYIENQLKKVEGLKVRMAYNGKKPRKQLQAAK